MASDDSDGGICGFTISIDVAGQCASVPDGQLLRCWAGSVGTIINSAETLPKTTAYVLT